MDGIGKVGILPVRSHIWRSLATILSSNDKPLSHKITSGEELANIFQSRKETPGFLMLRCEIQSLCFHPEDPRIIKFFQVFGPTLIELQLNNSIVCNDVLCKYFKRHGQILGSLTLKNYHSIQGYYLRFPAIENGIPVVLPKLGILIIQGSTPEFRPRLHEIVSACPNLIELHMDTMIDVSIPEGHIGFSFKKLTLLEIRAHSVYLISTGHLEAMEKMNITALKSLFLLGISFAVPDEKLNLIVESFGSSLEQLAIKMGNDSPNIPRICESRSPSLTRRGRNSRNSGRSNSRYCVNYYLKSAFPLRLPKLNLLVTDVNFQNEYKLFEVLPQLEKFMSFGTLASITHGVFPTLRCLELRQGDDNLLFDIYRSFPNLEELVIDDGSSITDFGIAGDEMDFGIVEEADDRYMEQWIMCEAVVSTISSLRRLKKFLANLSEDITDSAVFYGFAQCLMLEELCLSGSAITVESLKLIHQKLTSLKELQVRNCNNISYIDMLRIFYKNGERKVAVRWS